MGRGEQIEQTRMAITSKLQMERRTGHSTPTLAAADIARPPLQPADWSRFAAGQHTAARLAHGQHAAESPAAGAADQGPGGLDLLRRLRNITKN